MERKYAVGSGQKAVNASDGAAARTSSPAPCPLPPAHSLESTAYRLLPTAYSPRGITLIELLVTIVIIAIISAAVLGTASAAMENARRSRTRSTIAKINGLLMERWDSYATRRVDVSQAITGSGMTPPPTSTIEGAYASGRITSAQRGAMLVDARLFAMRELMKMELPDRWSDIVNQPLSNATPLNRPTFLKDVPALARTYYRRLAEVQANNDLEVVLDNQSAECLFLVIMYATGDGEARTLFPTADIGDTDGDGAPEFLDGWGNPIFFVRWPAGFVSPTLQTSQTTLMTGDPDGDHDPFDPFRRDSPQVTTPAPSDYPGVLQAAVQEMRNRNQQAVSNNAPWMQAFRLVPLVFSGGKDEDPGLHLAQTQQVFDPYSTYTGGSVEAQLATPLSRDIAGANYDGDTWRDNIHNHLIEY